MSARLAVNVMLRHPDNGEPRILLAGAEVPDWATGLVGDHCVEQAESDPSTHSVNAGGPPPKTGRGSSRDAWAAYAGAHEFEVEEGATREDIIAGLDAAGIPTS
jgi:hypothetical protein